MHTSLLDIERDHQLAPIYFYSADQSDEPFLQEMLYEAAMPKDWPRDQLPSLRTCLNSQGFNRYVNQWGRLDDMAVIARTETDQNIGAAWYRRYPHHELLGTLCIDRSQISDFEIVLGLVEGYRGEGIGKLLLSRLINQAAQNDIDELCLAVSDENPRAKRLYEQTGFTVVGHSKDHSIMTVPTREMAQAA